MSNQFYNPDMKIKLDPVSVTEVCGKSEQAMVYGFGHCKYLQVMNAFNKGDLSVKRAFECSIGNSYGYTGYSLPEECLMTLEGRKLEQFEAKSLEDIEDEILVHEKFCTRVCKAGAASLVLENYKRKQENLEIIPFIVCIDIDGNPFPYNPENIASRESKLNSIVTHAEMRRLYKMANTFEDLEVRKVAQETFKFVKLKGNEDDGYKLVSMKPFWEDSKWESAWQKREECKKVSSSNEKDPVYWRTQLQKRVNSYRNEG